MTTEYRIVHSGLDRTKGARWHEIEFDHDREDHTQAMNIHGGVLVRTWIIREEYATEESLAIGGGISVIKVDDVVVAQRWVVEIRQPHFDEETQEHRDGLTVVMRELSLVPSVPFNRQLVDAPLLPFNRQLVDAPLLAADATFRWYLAGEDMPRPTEAEVRHHLGKLKPPGEAKLLRGELDKMRDRYHEAKLETVEARSAAADEMPWVWSDDATANTLGALGNMMVVRITGGHLRALVEHGPSGTRPRATFEGKVYFDGGPHNDGCTVHRLYTLDAAGNVYDEKFVTTSDVDFGS